MTTGDIRPVYREFLDAIVALDRCIQRRDFESREYQKLRKKVDDLYPQLDSRERQDAYWFVLSLDRPGEGSNVPRGSDDE